MVSERDVKPGAHQVVGVDCAHDVGWVLEVSLTLLRVAIMSRRQGNGNSHLTPMSGNNPPEIFYV